MILLYVDDVIKMGDDGVIINSPRDPLFIHFIRFEWNKILRVPTNNYKIRALLHIGEMLNA